MSENDATKNAILEITERARAAARKMAVASTTQKNQGLTAMAHALVENHEAIIGANQQDVQRGAAGGLSAGMIDRLTLNTERIQGIADALLELVALPDPVGLVMRGSTLPNGLRLRQVRVPMGVVGMIYEARPNVTVDAAGLGLKSGNAVILRGGSAAQATNTAIVKVLADAVESAGLPRDSIQSIDAYGREGAVVLMKARGQVDLLVPRGGAGLIQTVVREAQVPVIETGVGNCHVYVDRDVDQSQALTLVMNSKIQRTSVCNATETVLVHQDRAEDFLPSALTALADAGVTIHGDETVVEMAPAGINILPATDEDWAAEYLDMEVVVGVVEDLQSAIAHIDKWSSGHTDAIFTTSLIAADTFVAEVDSAVVNVNASTRFTDGGEFGLGAEIGISTQKLHARGPMGLAELTTTKWIVNGDGQIRQ